MIACLQQMEHSGRDGVARRKSQAILRPLKRGEILLQSGARRIAGSAVKIELMLSRRFLNKSGGEIDRSVDSSRGRIRDLPRMNRQSFKLELIIHNPSF